MGQFGSGIGLVGGVRGTTMRCVTVWVLDGLGWRSEGTTMRCGTVWVWDRVGWRCERYYYEVWDSVGLG